MTEPCFLSAVEARTRIADKSLSPVALLDSCIAQIERANPVVNAVVATCFERARAEAIAAEAMAFKGEALPPLHGLPVLIKDLQDTEGLLTTYGSLLYKDHVPSGDESNVAVLRRSGAIVIGKTNTPEFGAGAHTVNKVYGATGNPFDPKRTCGGSSGGAAVALATNMAPLASGSDSGGSLRIPAAYCGVVAHRSTPGLVPTEKHGIGYTTYGVQGPMARSVADTVLMQSVLARYDGLDPLATPWAEDRFNAVAPVDLSTLRVAFSEDLGFAHVDDGLRAVFRERVAAFKSNFRNCAEAAPDLGDVRRCNWILRAVHFLSRHRNHYEQRRGELGQNVIDNYEAGLKLGAADVIWAMEEQTRIHRSMHAFFQEFDLLICPTVAVPPFSLTQRYCDQINDVKFDNYIEWMALTWGLTIPGNPITDLPCGLDRTGMPFGLQICGPHYQDAFVLGAAMALEDVFAGDPSLARPVSSLAALER
jgi:amidase